MINYLIFKETESGAHIIVNSINKFISRAFCNYDTVKTLANDYNTTKDAEKRTSIIDKILELLDTKVLTKLVESGDYSIDSEGRLYLNGIDEVIPEQLSVYMRKALEAKIDLTPYNNFWKNLVLNPDKAVRAQLFSFLEHNGHPITNNGYFLAYKAVVVKKKYDKNTGEEVKIIQYDEETGNEVVQPYTQEMVYTSIQTGPYGSIIKVGEPVSMPREECDSDPTRTCSHGLHVGSMDYVHNFGYTDKVVLEVLINPRNVVAVPIDYNNTKMRVCEYYVLAISNGENQNIYLESDYINYDKEQLEKELELYETKKGEVLAELEAKLEQMKIAAGLIKG